MFVVFLVLWLRERKRRIRLEASPKALDLGEVNQLKTEVASLRKRLRFRDRLEKYLRIDEELRGGNHGGEEFA